MFIIQKAENTRTELPLAVSAALDAYDPGVIGAGCTVLYQISNTMAKLAFELTMAEGRAALSRLLYRALTCVFESWLHRPSFQKQKIAALSASHNT